MGAEQSRVEDDLERNHVHGEIGDPMMLRDIARMDQVIRSKVRTGIQYNMKIILRGERGTGKTSLWRCFQGLAFSDKYLATPEIQSATINWSYRYGEHNVKVDVWDVVDKAIKPKSLPKFDGGQQGRHKVDYLDASIVDVYQDASAVVFLINPNSISSLTYVRNMTREVPLHITILVLFNFRDLLEHKNDQTTALQFEQVELLCSDIRSYRRDRFKAEKHLHQNTNGNSLRSIYGESSGIINENNINEEILLENNVFCFQTSLLNCFGLLEVNQFLDIPFLALKQQSLKKQLLQAQSDLLDSVQQLHLSTTQLRHTQHYTHFAARHNSNNIDHNQRVLGQNVATQAETEENDRSHKLSQSLHQRRQFEQEQLQHLQLKQQQQQQSQFSLKLDHCTDKNDRNISLNDDVIVHAEEHNIKKAKCKKDFKSSKHSKNHSKNSINTSLSDNQSNNNYMSNKIDSPLNSSHRDMFNDLDSDSNDNNHPFFETKEKKNVNFTQNKKTKQKMDNNEKIKNNSSYVNNSQQFEQEVALFTPTGQDLENFLQISDDEERFMRQQKDKIRQYVKSSKASKDTHNTKKNSSNHRNNFNDDDDDDDDNDFGDRFLAKKTVSSSSRLQSARRLRPSADL